jgi:hypothetical protein
MRTPLGRPPRWLSPSSASIVGFISLYYFLSYKWPLEHTKSKRRPSSYKRWACRFEVGDLHYKSIIFTHNNHVCEASATIKFFTGFYYLYYPSTHVTAPCKRGRDFKTLLARFHVGPMMCPLVSNRNWGFHATFLSIYC